MVMMVGTFFCFLLAVTGIFSEAAVDPCTNFTQLTEAGRAIGKLSNESLCDSNLLKGWFKFEIDNKAAELPTVCLQNDVCGTSLAMRVELNGKSMPAKVNQSVNATVCSSFKIFKKWDCCVLRQNVVIHRCMNFFVYHLEPVDRCPVAYCAQGKNVTTPEELTAKHGSAVTNSLKAQQLMHPDKIQTEDISQALILSSTSLPAMPSLTSKLATSSLMSAVAQLQSLTTELMSSEQILSTVSVDKDSALPGSGDAISFEGSGLNVVSTGLVSESDPLIPKHSKPAPTSSQLFTPATMVSSSFVISKDNDTMHKTISVFPSKISSSAIPASHSSFSTLSPVQTTSMLWPTTTLNPSSSSSSLMVTEPGDKQTLFEKHEILFIILIIVCIVCIIVIILGVIYLKCRQQSGTWDRESAENRDRFQIRPSEKSHLAAVESPLTDEEITKDENIKDHPNGFGNHLAMDEEEGMVVPIDQMSTDGENTVKDTVL